MVTQSDDVKLGEDIRSQIVLQKAEHVRLVSPLIEAGDLSFDDVGRRHVAKMGEASQPESDRIWCDGIHGQSQFAGPDILWIERI